ncbi:MAG: hypothetical protein NEHIOOID_00697 [Holosporales bacterium]
MNSSYLYNAKYFSITALFINLIALIALFFGYEIVAGLLFSLNTILLFATNYMQHVFIKNLKDMDEFFESEKILVRNDDYTGKHFIDNIENIKGYIVHLKESAKIFQEEHNSLNGIFNFLKKWRSGDLEERIPLSLANGQKVMIQFINCLNDLVDEIDAYIRESLGAMDALANRRYYRTIVEKGLVGSFLIGAKRVNSGLVMFGKQSTELLDKLQTDIKSIVSIVVNETDQVSKSCQETVFSCRKTVEKSSDASVEAKNTHQGLIFIEKMSNELIESGEMVVKVAQNATDLSKEASYEIEKTRNIVTELKTRSATIHGIVEMIREVAQKTNLLSINAAIEAAKAGKEGHGFRIVADEVRSLAHTTMGSAEDIEKQIKAIQEAIQETVSSVSKFTNTMMDINTVSGSMFEKVDNQIEVLDGISSKIKMFSNSMQHLISNVENVKEASTSARDSARHINDTFQTLNENINIMEESITKTISSIN